MSGDTNSVDERSSAETADYRDRLHAAAEASTNWAGSIVDDDRREVVIYGVGTPTEELVTVIAEAPYTLRASEDRTGALNARFPVTIEYGGAPYPLARAASDAPRRQVRRPSAAARRRVQERRGAIPCG